MNNYMNYSSFAFAQLLGVQEFRSYRR